MIIIAIKRKTEKEKNNKINLLQFFNMLIFNVINLKNSAYQRIATYLTAKKLPFRQPEEENVPSISLKRNLKISK